jgi:glyoxylase-like metal-dependent hydrolase (beta-lactamase superfamily II)
MKRLHYAFRHVWGAVALAALLAWPQALAATPNRLELWRLDCGSVDIPDADFLNDSFALAGVHKTVVVSCYLIRDGDRFLLWDAGLPLSRLGAGRRSVGGGRAILSKTILAQLSAMKVDPRQVKLVALSHYHSDHSGQLATLPWATLMIGQQDLEVVRSTAAAFNLERSEFGPWLTGGAKVDGVVGDRDIFGDGRVIMLATPGHTPGHHSLLVKLSSGPVILTGDLWHFREQIRIHGVPKINTSRADSLASMDRIEQIARNLSASFIIGHDDRDTKMPPSAAR